MASTTDLCKVLADALGVEREVVADHARRLFEGEKFTGADATPEHAGALLIALMSGAAPDKAPDAVRVYAQLPLGQVTTGYTTPGGLYEGGRVADDDLLLQDLNDLGETFGEFLDGLIWALSEPMDALSVPARITIGGGPGTTYATVDFLVSAGGIDRGYMVSFSLAPFGGGWLPDDAAVARLDISATVPGTIFDVLQEFFSETDSPREVALAHIRAGGLQGD